MAVVTDLGTEFGVEVDRSGPAGHTSFRARSRVLESRPERRVPGWARAVDLDAELGAQVGHYGRGSADGKRDKGRGASEMVGPISG